MIGAFIGGAILGHLLTGERVETRTVVKEVEKKIYVDTKPPPEPTAFSLTQVHADRIKDRQLICAHDFDGRTYRCRKCRVSRIDYEMRGYGR